MADKKLELKVEQLNEITPDRMVDLIDGIMESGVSRLKLKESEDLDPGHLLRQYHHGRCDIGSPWATGKAFDVIE